MTSKSARIFAMWLRDLARFSPFDSVIVGKWVLAVGLLCMLIAVPAAAQPSLKDAFGRMVDGAADEPTAAAGDGDASSAPSPRKPGDELKRETPRGAVVGFLEATRNRDYERAAQYLFLGTLPTGWTVDDGPRLARYLKTVLDRTLWVDIPMLSREAEGHKDDGLPDGRDWVGRIQAKNGPVDVYVQRIRPKDGEKIWKFSSYTVAQIPDLYEEFGDGPLANVLPPLFFELQAFDVQLWQALGIFVLLGLATIIAFLVTGLFGWVFRRLPGQLATRLSPVIIGPLRLLLLVFAFTAARLVLNLPLHVVSVIGGIEQVLRIFAVTWAVLRLLDVVASQLLDRLVQRGQVSAIGLVPPSRRIAQFVIVGIGVVIGLSSVGFNVTALVAGLGVGGIAIALAAQKSIEHLFGGATLYADQPVKVGDFCRFGDKMGTIEEIGLRSTRVRTLDRTLLTIPNAEFSNLQLENFSKRDKFWFHPRLSLRYETTPDQMRYVLIELRKLLYQHPKVEMDPCRVRFTNFGAFSLDLDIFAYVEAKDMNEFLAVSEDLNLRMMEIINEAGAGFAFPSQTLYVEKGEPPDAERIKHAEEQVRRWREDEALYVTTFPADKIQEISNTLDYPPKGSPSDIPRGR